MPIEIKEVVIKTVVDPQSGDSPGSTAQSGAGAPAAGANEQELIQKIMEMIDDKEER